MRYKYKPTLACLLLSVEDLGGRGSLVLWQLFVLNCYELQPHASGRSRSSGEENIPPLNPSQK